MVLYFKIMDYYESIPPLMFVIKIYIVLINIFFIKGYIVTTFTNTIVTLYLIQFTLSKHSFTSDACVIVYFEYFETKISYLSKRVCKNWFWYHQTCYKLPFISGSL